MIISQGRNYIFVHIPKTGGTSLALALEGRAMKDDILIGDTPKARNRRGRLTGVESAGRLWKHSTLADIEGVVPQAFIAQAFCVTMVRNPWDRMVSYYHWLREQRFDHPAVQLAKSLAFAPFLTHPHTQETLRRNPYGSYMRMADGTVRAALFIRLERFEEDAAPLWEHLGFSLDLPHENASARAGDYRGFYESHTRSLIEDLCAEDIARFGYVF